MEKNRFVEELNLQKEWVARRVNPVLDAIESAYGADMLYFVATIVSDRVRAARQRDLDELAASRPPFEL